MLKGVRGKGDSGKQSSPAVTLRPASAPLLTSCLCCCGEGNENKRLLWLAVRQPAYSLDSKRLSHEGLISAAPQFCRIKQQCEGKMEQKNKKKPTEIGSFHRVFVLLRMVPLGFCLREMSFSQSLAILNAFHLLPTQRPQLIIGCRCVGSKPVWGQVLPWGLPSGRGWHEQMGRVAFLPWTWELVPRLESTI